MNGNNDHHQVPGSLKTVLQDAGDKVSHVLNETGDLISLKLHLFKAEVKENIKVITRNSMLIISGVFIGLFAILLLLCFLILVIAALLPITEPWNYVASSGGLFLLFATSAVLLILQGIKKLNNEPIIPEESIAELEKDKEWVKNINHD